MAIRRLRWNDDGAALAATERLPDREEIRPLLTHHGATLLAVADDPEIRVADLARKVCVTERTAYRLLADLNAWGYVRRVRVGRRNHYEVNESGDVMGHLADVLQLRYPARAAS